MVCVVVWHDFCIVLICISTIAIQVYNNNNLKTQKMATNKPTGDNARKGAVKDRTQVLNPRTGLWTKRDSETGRFMDVKTSSNDSFKGITKEKK